MADKRKPDETAPTGMDTADAAPDSTGLPSGHVTAGEGVRMLDTPNVAPDGHVILSQEDIDAREGRSG